MVTQLFLVTPAGAQPLPLPPAAAHNSDIHTLFDNLPLGVYTALRTFEHNKFLYLEAHLDRLEQSMALLGWDFRLPRPDLCQALDQACTAYPGRDARVRIDVLAAAPARWGLDQRDDTGRVLIALAPFTPPPDHCYQEGVSVDLAPGLHRDHPQAKTANFVLARRAELARHTAPAGREAPYEYLLTDPAGYILEGSSSNFYAVRQGTIWTAGEGVLGGITQHILFQLLETLRLPLRHQAIHVADLPTLDEAFLTSSSRGVIPIVRVDGQPIGSARPGPITHQLITAYNQHVTQALRRATSPTP